ncbi:LysR family transcriptional regulator [Trinickia sp. Y13]|uniref:LysR family transcriptional regulator n=1 Tax=Trinickia sp. Y13 TaxID=2917807 RepID=UPI0024063848|nr:LysR family transcriptional regulator [Trinickia sp. Y13]MDG0025005.1 LysR family transcriptional regulator [Trinickia sp. Y13]
MDKLDMMRIFVRIAEEGSFTGAASRLDIQTANASRAISQLESQLRTRLLHRSTRRLALTEAGQRYLDRCKRILECVDEAEAEAANARVDPSGRLRVHASPSFGQAYVVPTLVRYRESYPAVSIELTLSHHTPDIIEAGYDVMLQLSTTELPDSRLVSHRLGDVHNVLCAAPAYLNTHGVPRTAQDLEAHTCLQFVTTFLPRDRWHLHGPNGRETVAFPKAPVEINLPDALSVALREGIGIGALPMSTALAMFDRGELVRVLHEYRLQRLTAYAVHASRKYLDAKIKTFMDYLRETVPKALAADAQALCRAARLP